jgi:hypothetical protein
MRATVEYALAPDVFVANSGRWVTLLDVRSDNYFCITKDQWDAIAAYLPTATQQSLSRDVDAHPSHDSEQLLEALVNRGILCHAETAVNRQSRTTPIATPESTLPCGGTRSSALQTSRFAVPFWRACRKADRELTCDALAVTIERVRLRRASAGASTQFNLSAAVGRVDAFNALRWWYPRAYLCMFDSLALLHFLEDGEMFPRWIFGATPEPFQAHCWLQEGAVVLNDSLERVCTYTPLMAV